MALIAVQMLTACTYSLKMKAEVPPRNESVTAASLAAKKFNKYMIIPQQGTVRGAYDAQIALLESGFIKIGTTVVTAAVTARSVVDVNKKSEKCCDSGATIASLSDVERALLMAKESGADAILQIGAFEWSKTEGMPARYFIRENDKAYYSEVAQKKYLDFVGYKYLFNADRLVFIGRLIDVQTGEVMAAFDISCFANWTLPEDYQATLAERWGHNSIATENYSYYGYFWPDAKRKTELKIIQEIIKVVSSKGKA